MIDIEIQGIRYIHTEPEEGDKCLLHKGGELNYDKVWLGCGKPAGDYFPSRSKVICGDCMRDFKDKSIKEQQILMAMWKIKENK